MNPSVANTPADKIFLDANILTEIILSREKDEVARAVIHKYRERSYVSALTAHLVMHFGQKIVDLPVLRKFLADYTVFSLEPSDFEWAFANIRDRDFEDALQLSVAIKNGCDLFLTFDKPLAANYKDLSSIKVELVK